MILMFALGVVLAVLLIIILLISCLIHGTGNEICLKLTLFLVYYNFFNINFNSVFGSIQQVKLKSPFWQNKTRNPNFVKLTGLINNLKSFVKLIA